MRKCLLLLLLHNGSTQNRVTRFHKQQGQTKRWTTQAKMVYECLMKVNKSTNCMHSRKEEKGEAILFIKYYHIHRQVLLHADAICLYFGLHAIAPTGPVWPSNLETKFPETRFQQSIVPFLFPITTD